MAYSMNWRPDQDTAPVEASSNAPAPSFGTGSPRRIGPIQGILPPGRQSGATTSFTPSTTKFSSSYSMNWKPPDMDAKPEQASSADVQVQARPAAVEDQGMSSFRALLTPCPTVKLIRGKAASSEVDGMVCTMEQDDQLERAWAIRFHPCRQPLTFFQSLNLSRAVVNCLYAVICQQDIVRTIFMDVPARHEVHCDVYQVVKSLGIASRSIEPSTILQLHAYLDTAFLTPLNPSLRKNWSSLESPRICFGTSTDTMYTRFSPALAAYVQFEPVKIETGQGMRISCRKDAASQARYSVDVLFQTSNEIVNLSLENDGDVHPGDLCVTVLTPTTAPVFSEAYLVSLCHFVLMDDPRRSQIFFAAWDPHLEKMLRKYGAGIAMYLAVDEIPSTKGKAPVIYRLKATSFWDKVKVL